MLLTSIKVFGLTAATLFGSTGAWPSGPAAPRPSMPFDEAIIFVEYNATDDDAEVVVSVDADLGLARFAVLAPNGKEILNLRSKHTRDIGIRKINLETPEPSLEDVLEAYPEGWYRFIGRSTHGQHLVSVVHLSHDLPEAPEITFPADGAENVPTSGAAATWTAGCDAESFFFELEQDELGVDLKSNIPGDARSLGFPEGFLASDTEYQLGVGARAGNGNLTVVEIHFTTAP